jgi:hypothetical protein
VDQPWLNFIFSLILHSDEDVDSDRLTTVLNQATIFGSQIYGELRESCSKWEAQGSGTCAGNVITRMTDDDNDNPESY